MKTFYQLTPSALKACIKIEEAQDHFCTYAISLNGIGMTNTLALDKQSFTKAGLQRGCGNYYLTTKQLNVELHQQWLK